MREIIARPAFVAAAVTGLVAFGTMNLIMTSTPVEMMLCGYGVAASATVIQAHAVAMYAPGFFTGRLIARYGTARIAVLGAALSALCVLVGLQGQGFWHFALALALLGLGWNFMFVSAPPRCSPPPTSRWSASGRRPRTTSSSSAPSPAPPSCPASSTPAAAGPRSTFPSCRRSRSPSRCWRGSAGTTPHGRSRRPAGHSGDRRHRRAPLSAPRTNALDDEDRSGIYS